MFEYFDTHSHLHFKDFDADREKIIFEMKKNKIATISVGVDFETSKKEVELAEKYENVFACIGQHPEDLNLDSVFDDRLESLVGNKRVVAIGECGLDYFRLSPEEEYLKNVQRKIFECQINLAIKFHKPLMLHIRPSKRSQDAYNDALDILEHYAKTFGDKLRGNSHFFAGDIEILKRLLGIGFTVSFTGVITFTNDYNELIKYTPVDMIMSETDAPFVAPVPYRGKKNSPLYITEIVKKIAEIRKEPFDGVKRALKDNTLRCFPSISSIAS